MKKLLLIVLATAVLVSCSNDSSPKSAPPAPGRDGDQWVGNESIAFGSQNDGTIAIEKGKDLVLAVGFPLGLDLKGQLRLTVLKTDLEEQIEKIPKPIKPKDQATLDKLCFLANTPHRWLLRHQGVDTLVLSGQPVNFDFGTILYLAIETRTLPKCERLSYSFKSELLESTRKPEPLPSPTPTPTPSPTPAIGARSEPVVLINSLDQRGLNVSYSGNGSRNFAYKVSMMVDGPTFGGGENVEKILVNIFDKNSERYVAPWTEIATFNPAAPLPKEYRLEFTFDKFSAPNYLIDNQEDMILTFAINSATDSKLPLRLLDLSEQCYQHSQSFVEVSTGKKGCN
jgi:hypothetical protein